MTPTRKIAIILGLIFLIPALFFSVYEISGLSRDEKMIESIYQKQLEAILFSVNQYSDDAANGWMAKLEAKRANVSTSQAALQEFLMLNTTTVLFFTADSSAGKLQPRIFSLDSTLNVKYGPLLKDVINRNTKTVRQLSKYKRSGFQKLEALNDSLKQLSPLQVVVWESQVQGTSTLCGLLLDPELYIENIVGPRLQSIAQEQFILSVWNTQNNAQLYSTLTLDSARFEQQALTKSFWIFPSYKLGIRTNGASVESLVRERTNTNLLLLIGLDVVLMAALLLAFRSVKKEVQLAQNKADFVSNVSHEIRTPLALISMFAETLELGRTKSEEKKQEYYAIISKETQRLSGIVNKILNFSQMEAGKKILHVEPVSLHILLSDILHTYDFHLKNKGFSYQVDEADSIMVLADKAALTEIIINLIDNAIKYSTLEKRLIFSFSTTADMATLAVRDFGIGIHATDQKHIFDKFYRVSTGNLAKGPGTGLGLSLVKQLVEQQRGTISVSSDLGKGSTFFVTLPLSK